MTVNKLREEIETLKSILEYCEDNDVTELPTESNTYFVNSNHFMQIGSYGFLDYGSINDAIWDGCTTIEDGTLVIESDY